MPNTPEKPDQSYIDEQVDWYSPGRRKAAQRSLEETHDMQQSSRFQTMIQKLHIGTTLAALVLFFLPWIDIQCSEQSFATQSGVQTIYGGGTMAAGMEAIAEKESGGEADKEESLGFSILVALALVAVIGAVVMSFKALRSGDERQSNLVGMLCAAALVLIAAQMMIGFPVKKSFADSVAESSNAAKSGDPMDNFSSGMADAMMIQIQIRHLPALYLELIMLGLPTLVLANGLLDRMKER